jgi:hypothetical protein
MNYAGLRIVMPGDIGEVYHSIDALQIPKNLYLLNPGPDFLMRLWSGPSGFDQTVWLADNSATKRFQFHHNMYNIYPPEKFSHSNPEFYPVIRGERYLPQPGKKDNWQPTYSEPALIPVAVDYADNLFSNNPHLQSVSVAVNDGGGFSELDAYPEHVGINNNYYLYVDAVAKSVNNLWPDKFVTFLPYAAVQDPPDFPLSDNVMMFIFSKEGNPGDVYQRWKGKIANIGIYQWLYGAGWVIPNQWPHAIQDYLKWVYDAGGRAFKGEAYVAWAQGGAKMWVLSNLLWNVNADVDALLEDYFHHTYGPYAAPAMKRFFDQAEMIYERRRSEGEFNLTRWQPGAYQFEYATEEDFDLMWQALNEACDRAVEKRNRQRINLTKICFKYGHYYWRQHQLYEQFMAMIEDQPLTLKRAEQALHVATDFYTIQEQRREYRDRVVETHLNYCVPTFGGDNTNLWWRADPMFDWDGLDDRVSHVATIISDLKQRSMRTAEVGHYWVQKGRAHSVLKPFADEQRLLININNPLLKNLLSNGSFEIEEDPMYRTDDVTFNKLQTKEIKYSDADAYDIPRALCKDWYVYLKQGTANMNIGIDEHISSHGEVSARAKGLSLHAGIIQNVGVPSNRNRYRLSFLYRTSDDTRYAFWGVFHYNLKRVVHKWERIAPSSEWKKYETNLTINYPDAVDTDFTLVLALERGQSISSQIWFDKVRLEMLSPCGLRIPAETCH